jgi:hypothetical protein
VEVAFAPKRQCHNGGNHNQKSQRFRTLETIHCCITMYVSVFRTQYSEGGTAISWAKSQFPFFISEYTFGDIWKKLPSCLPSGRHAVAYWLRHYATSQKIAGSRPNKVNEFFRFT